MISRQRFEFINQDPPSLELKPGNLYQRISFFKCLNLSSQKKTSHESIKYSIPRHPSEFSFTNWTWCQAFSLSPSLSLPLLYPAPLSNGIGFICVIPWNNSPLFIHSSYNPSPTIFSIPLFYLIINNPLTSSLYPSDICVLISGIRHQILRWLYFRKRGLGFWRGEDGRIGFPSFCDIDIRIPNDCLVAMNIRMNPSLTPCVSFPFEILSSPLVNTST